jgi:hypothetical protein
MLAIPSIRYNSGRKPTGAKLALKPVHVWGIRIRLQVACKARDLALFDSSARSTCRLTSAMGRKHTLSLYVRNWWKADDRRPSRSKSRLDSTT